MLLTKFSLILILYLLLVNHSGGSFSLVRSLMPNTIPSSMKATFDQRIQAHLLETELKLKKWTLAATANGTLNQNVVCGLANNEESISGRIIGGTETSSNEFPWQVYLFKETNSGARYVCGGSIIDSQWVLTAAHCVEGNLASAVTVYLGSHNVWSDNEPNRIVVKTTDYHIHSQYNSITIKNDIALIRLPIKIPFNDYIRPVCLPKSTDLDEHVGDPVTLTGWGATSDGGKTSHVLMKVSSTVISNTKCGSFFNNVDESNICIMGDASVNICGGDSGGPMNFLNDNGITWTAIGLVSFGLTECEVRFPSVFTRISFYLDWIDSYVRNSNNLPTGTYKTTTKAYRNQANYLSASFSSSMLLVIIPAIVITVLLF